MKKNNFCCNLSLSLFSVIIVLSLSELFVRLFYPFIKNYDMERWRYAVSCNIAHRNPYHFHTHKPGTYFKELYGVKVKINSKGLRDNEYSYFKPAGTYRILVLGDSLTFGWGVPFEDTYPKHLERMLNAQNANMKFQVINAGICNYNILLEKEFLRNEGLKYNPDMIILGCFINDAEIFQPSVNFFNKHSYLYVYLWSKINTLRANLLEKYNYINYYRSLYKDGSKSKVQFEASVKELEQIVCEKRITLLTILLPDLHNLRAYPFKDLHLYVQKLFGWATVVDMLAYFDIDKDPVFYWVSKEDPHYNKQAHRIVAKGLYSEIRRIINNP